MTVLKSLSILLFALVLSGCATVEPMTFEESLETSRATRNDVRDWEEELRYRVELQYANTARQKLESTELEIPPNTNIDFMVPFAIWEYARGNSLGGGIAVADWLNSGLTKESRYRTYYNRGLGYMGHPNTHYFTFDERDGIATPADVHDAWDEAYALFQSVFNRDGNCRVFGYTEEYQYARTYSKNVPGKYIDVGWHCRHPLFENQQQKVVVTAYANPFDGVRVIAGVVTQCWVQPPRKQKFTDLRGCGITLADRQRPYLTDSRFGWTELITTPQSDAPHLFEVVVRQGDQLTTLPAPESTEEYQAFLQSQ
jgi:hypothetical protein